MITVEINRTVLIKEVDIGSRRKETFRSILEVMKSGNENTIEELV